jgi:hypothetical protein
MNRVMAIVLTSAVLLALIAGCGDDEKPLCPTPEPTPKYLILGTVILRPYVDFMGSIHPINGQANEIDSILFGDSACVIDKTGSYVEGNNYTYNFHYLNESDFIRFHSGDTVVVRIVMGQETATVRLNLVANPVDSILIVNPPQYANMPLDSDIAVDWRPIQHADWYSVSYLYDTSNVMGHPFDYIYDFAADTSYVIPGDLLTTDGQVDIFVSGVTGPVPGQPGNVKSYSMTGSIYSWAVPGVRRGWRVIVGAGMPPSSQELHSPVISDTPMRYSQLRD